MGKAGQKCQGMDWYAVHTKPNAERMVRDQIRLLGVGYRSFYPFCMIRRRRKWSRGRTIDEVVPRPYFSRYLFVGIMPWCTLAPIFSMVGVGTVVRTASSDGEFRPLRIDPEQMEGLLARADDEGQVGVQPFAAEPDHPYLAGDVVEFNRAGPFAGFTCTVDRLKKDGMLAVVSEMFSASRSMDIHHSQLGDVLKREHLKRA